MSSGNLNCSRLYFLLLRFSEFDENKPRVQDSWYVLCNYLLLHKIIDPNSKMTTQISIKNYAQFGQVRKEKTDKYVQR